MKKYISARLLVLYEHTCDDYMKLRQEKCEVEKEYIYNRVDFLKLHWLFVVWDCHLFPSVTGMGSFQSNYIM